MALEMTDIFLGLIPSRNIPGRKEPVLEKLYLNSTKLNQNNTVNNKRYHTI